MMPRVLHVVLGLAIAVLPSLDALAGSATADTATEMLPTNVLVQALAQGEASGPLPDQPALASVIQRLKRQANNTGPIELKAKRVVRFSQQSRCGRVMFGIWQPASHSAWPALGGAINICDDGLPPLRACRAQHDVLVPPTVTCPDRSVPQDTAEVAEAIRASLAHGNLSSAQARDAVRAAATAAEGVSTAPGASGPRQ